MKTNTLTPELKEEAKTIYNTYFNDFNYALDQKRSLINERSFCLDLHRQRDAINAVVEFLCFVDGKSDKIADLLTQNLNIGNKEAIKDNFYLFSYISNVVNYREELFTLQDIFYKRSGLIKEVENGCGISEILKS